MALRPRKNEYLRGLLDSVMTLPFSSNFIVVVSNDSLQLSVPSVNTINALAIAWSRKILKASLVIAIRLPWLSGLKLISIVANSPSIEVPRILADSKSEFSAKEIDASSYIKLGRNSLTKFIKSVWLYAFSKKIFWFIICVDPR